MLMKDSDKRVAALNPVAPGWPLALGPKAPCTDPARLNNLRHPPQGKVEIFQAEFEDGNGEHLQEAETIENTAVINLKCQKVFHCDVVDHAAESNTISEPREQTSRFP